MARLCRISFFSLIVMLAQLNLAAAENYDRDDAGWIINNVPYLISPPESDGPIKVDISFELFDIANISDADATADFTGELQLTWMDPRSAFDPDVAGVKEKTYSGDFQFNELSPRWYPQLVLLNEAFRYEANAILVKIQPDGTTSLIRDLNASARTHMDLTYYPFDSQKLRLEFGVVDYNVLQLIFEAKDMIYSPDNLVEQDPEWKTNSFHYILGTRNSVNFSSDIGSSTFTVEIDLTRKPDFVIRTVIIPLLLIVLLTFSVFWLDIKDIQGRVNISFVGLLTITAYQLVVGDFLPHVAYFSFMQGLVLISLSAITITILMTVWMAKYIDSKPKLHMVNKACIWVFPSFYLLSLWVMYLNLTPLVALQ